MTQSLLIRYYNEVQDSFHQYFWKTLEEQDVEDIHKLRVSVKKLRSIWSLVEAISHNELSRQTYFSMVAKLFSTAGKVREAQINRTLISKYRVKYLVQYADFLMKIEERYTCRMLEIMQQFDQEALEAQHELLLRSMTALPEELVWKELAGYILKEFRKTRRQVELPQKKRDLHKIRIHIRNVNTLLVIMMKLNPSSAMIRLKKIVKPLIIELGDWHDYIVLHYSLQKYAKRVSNKKSKKHLEKFIKRVKAQHEARAKKLIRRISKDITPKRLKVIEKMV